MRADGHRFWRRLARQGVAHTLALGWLATVLVLASLANALPIPAPDSIKPANRMAPLGTRGHLLGTDELGRDIASRLIYGARVSLLVSGLALLMGLLLGLTLGLLAGYLKGAVRTVIMWLTDVILSFPALVLLISVVAFAGRSLLNIGLALGIIAVPTFARLACAQTLTLSEREYVKAAKAYGSTNLGVLVRELLPNVMPVLSAYGFVFMGGAIVAEGSLSFLGLSVSAPTPSWGGMIAAGQIFLRSNPSLALVPAAAMCLTVLSLCIVGDRLKVSDRLEGT